MKKYFKNSLIVLFLILPILIYLILMVLYNIPIKTIIKELAFNVSLLMLFSIVIWTIKSKSTRLLFTIFLMLFHFVLFVQIGILYTFHNFIDNTILYTSFETNFQEIIGFFKSYIKWYEVAIVFFYLYLLSKIVYSYPFYLFKHKWIPALCGIIFLGIGIRFYEQSVTSISLSAYIDYREFTDLLSKNITRKTSDYFTNVSNNDKEALYVVIVGESTSRRNMGIYGYYRNTNPELTQMKSELYLFNQVISPRTHTILSLDRIFSMADYKNPNHNELGTVFQLANQAGFKTYWLSNQQPIGANESLVSIYAKATNEQHFITKNPEKNYQPDEILFPILDNAIRDTSSPKKVIFVHLKGTHLYYKDSYPSEFEYFNDTPKTAFPSKEAHQTINDYDNSVRYNDFIVAEIIRKVKKSNKNSFVLYFSDHGDDVYQDTNSFGHYESIGSNAMYQIPYIVWLSDKYKQNSAINFDKYLHRKYILEDFIHSFANLTKIQFDQFQPKKSIFNDKFIYKKRTISPGINYDERK